MLERTNGSYKRSLYRANQSDPEILRWLLRWLVRGRLRWLGFRDCLSGTFGRGPFTGFFADLILIGARFSTALGFEFRFLLAPVLLRLNLLLAFASWCFHLRFPV